MILVMDVGNTNIVLGIYKQGQLLYNWRIATAREKTEDEYAMLLKQLFADKNLSFADIQDVVLSSVVPPLMFALERMCSKYLNTKPLVITNKIKTGLEIMLDNPQELGADRIVNAVAALHHYKPPLIVVDFGTATTFCVIDEQGRYLGGAITPGIRISTEALFNKAAKLPRIELVRPEKVIGTNTVISMQSGIVYGYIGQLNGIVERICREAGFTDVTVVATGGLAELIATECSSVNYIDELLTIKGLYLLYQKNIITGGD